MSSLRHVVFRVASERYALPLEAVREVVLPQPPFSRVPRTSEAVHGVLNLRGRVVAVVDLAALVGLPSQPLLEGAGQVLILDHGKRALGLLIAGVLGVWDLAVQAESRGLVRGVGSVPAGAVTMLGAEPLFEAAVALFGER